MSNKKNDDEYFFDDEDLGSFGSELDGENEQENEPEKVADSFDGGESNGFDSAIDSEDIDDDEELTATSGFAEKAKEFAGKHTRILIVVGVAIVAIIGLKLFLSSPTDTQKLMQAPVVQQRAPVQQQAPVVIQQKPSVSKRQLNSVANVASSNKNNLNALQSRIGNMSAKQADTADAISQLSGQIQQMQSTNQQLSAQVKLMEKREQDRLKKETYKKTHYVHYRVKALESGRAWLMGSNGMSTTVSVGSKLPHYGEVLSIDVDNGTVVTSSGSTLKYGLNERVNSAVSK